MTAPAFSVQDGYGYYHAADYRTAVVIALADTATSCTIFKNGTAVAHKAAHSDVIDLIDTNGIYAA
jgi:hypothetical protein